MKDIMEPLSGFDEANYLTLNRDVANAVRDGAFSSGWAHVLFHGYHEGRAGIPADIVRRISRTGVNSEQATPARVPPPSLRARVQGFADLRTFYMVGERIAADIEQTFKLSDIAIAPGATVLDFGCGCGRVIQQLRRTHPDWNLFGTDIDEQAIEWCSKQIGDVAEFHRNNILPPCPFNDKFFDFVYSVSVFTHLPEDMQFTWLDELRRITKPGSVLFLTTHNIDIATSNRERENLENGFCYELTGVVDGLPDYYQTSYHSHDYIHSRWVDYFEVRCILEKRIVRIRT